MIELAPKHKSGLQVSNPILFAAGVISDDGRAYPALRAACIGGAVIGPITWQSRRGATPPRLAESDGGFVLGVGLQNRGAKATMKHVRRSWSRLGYPVIAQVADSEPELMTRVVQLLEECDSVAGLELLLQPEIEPSQVGLLIRAVASACELPVWVKLPFDSAQSLAAAVIDAGADALVVCQLPQGAVSRTGGAHEDLRTVVSGSFYGTAVHPLVLHKVSQIVALDLGAPVIACGGIHSWRDARTLFDAGVAGVQLDSALWVEPALVSHILAGWIAENDLATGQ